MNSKADKLEALKKTMGAIDKKLGTGSVRFLGENRGLNITRHSTGIVAIDNILGGGIPCGRIVEVYGPESSGKCITADTKVLTVDGYKSVAKIFEECNQPLNTSTKIVPQSYPLVNMYGEIENTSHFTTNGVQAVYRVITKTSHFNESCNPNEWSCPQGTANHPLRVVSDGGFPIWKNISDIVAGDILIGMSEKETTIDPDETIIPQLKQIVLDCYSNIPEEFKTSRMNSRIESLLAGKLNVSLSLLKSLSTMTTYMNPLKNIIEYYLNPMLRFEVVSEVVYIGDLPTYDFVMPTTHSFIATGIINHNTTLTLHIIADVQKKDGIVAFIDVEHALDPVYAAALGVDIDSLIIAQPDSGEDALDITEQLISSGAVDMIVIDSVAALVPKAEIEGDMGDSHMGLQARLMSQALRKITGISSKMNTSVIFINQLREKIGGMSYGSNETTTGGRALKFFSSIRIDIRKIEQIKGKDGAIIGAKTKIKCVKNKTFPPFKEAIVQVRFGEGFSREYSIIDLAIANGAIQKGGAWYTLGEQRFQGQDAVVEFLKTNPKELELLEIKCKNIFEAVDTTDDNK